MCDKLEDKNGYRIRTLNIEDYDDIVEVWNRAGLPTKPKGRDSRESISEQMKNFPDLFIGIEYREKLVGVVLGSYDGRKGWINRLAVLPEYRRLGLAARLIEEVERRLKARGAKITCALVEGDNEASARLFEKVGYKRYKDIIYFTKRESDDV
jgi:ribosomal protein S18 acetylase RimI-like enzyme